MINKEKEPSRLLLFYIKIVFQGNQKVDNGKFFTEFQLINVDGIMKREKHSFLTLSEIMDLSFYRQWMLKPSARLMEIL